MATLADNKDARRRYHILDTFEAGIALTGHETKSARQGTASLKSSFVVMKNNEPFLTNLHIGSFQPQNAPKGYNPTRPRKLLLHKKEIKQILGRRSAQGLTVVPLKIYTSHGRLKVQIGIARSKTKADKREVLKKRAADREIRRVMRGK